MASHMLDVGLLHQAVDQRRGMRGMTWAQVGVETGLPGSFFSRLGQGKTPSADALCSLLAWIGQGHACGFAREKTDDT